MRKFVSMLLLGVFVAMALNTARAETIEERIKRYGIDYGKGYVGPFVNAFGASLNSGWISTADVSNGVSIYIGLKAMYMPIPEDGKNFNFANPFGHTDNVPTLFGENVAKPMNTGAFVIPPGYASQYAPGTGLNFVPMLVPHIAIGNIFGTRLMLRFIPKMTVQDIGDITFFGAGLQHSISQYIPFFPLDLAAHVAFQNLSVGDLVTTKAFTFGAEVSKSFAIFTLYGGVAYESSSMNFSYTASYAIPGGTKTEKVGFDIPGSNTVRATIGLGIDLAIIKITADYSVAKQPVASAGIGIGW